MKQELLDKALEKIPDPNILINVVSKRVRDLHLHNHALKKHEPCNVPGPLVAGVETEEAEDIALKEIAEGKLWYELPPLD
ncbi:MAG: DNA-directed RNA polymerase subunit omega [Opitutales bacterium]|nr:DNA-directed RNA polymerase subunit omega [Opitutales bacterium]